MPEYFVTAHFICHEEQVLSVMANSKAEAARLIRAGGGEVESTRTLNASPYRVSEVRLNE